jgi:hypothetical protein
MVVRLYPPIAKAPLESPIRIVGPALLPSRDPLLATGLPGGAALPASLELPWDSIPDFAKRRQHDDPDAGCDLR